MNSVIKKTFHSFYRCLESEKECQQLQARTTELRRKLDDCQAGLQELGRENQSLQVCSVRNNLKKSM